MGTTAVRVLGPADAAPAAEALARGFDHEPAKLGLLPDPAARRLVLELAARNRLYDALRYGTVHGAVTAGELAAVAVWTPPGVRAVSVAGVLRAVARTVRNLRPLVAAGRPIVSVLRSDLAGAATMVRQRHRAVVRASRGTTWTLSLLATVPEHRGKGLARSLLERQLRRCDEDGAAVWLETTDPANLPFYERFGFELVAAIDHPDWLPGLWVMRRDPLRP